MVISIIPEWFSNSTNIENTLSQSWLSNLANICVAFGTILLAILTYRSMIELKKQYKFNYMRDKAKLIETTTIKPLIQKIDELRNYIDEKKYIRYDQIEKEPLIKLLKNSFLVQSYDIFKIDNGKIVLIYNEDSNLTQYMNKALNYLNDYHINASNLEKLVNAVYKSNIPYSFIQVVDEIIIKESRIHPKTNVMNPYEIDDNDKSKLYFLIVFGSTKGYEAGSSTIIMLLNNYYNDLQSAVANDSEIQLLFNEIQNELSNINFNLNNAYDEIQKLHEIWQNEFII